MPNFSRNELFVLCSAGCFDALMDDEQDDLHAYPESGKTSGHG